MPSESAQTLVRSQPCRQELDKGGWRLSPVAQRLRSLLGEEGTPAGAAAAAPADSGHSSRPPVPMI